MKQIQPLISHAKEVALSVRWHFAGSIFILLFLAGISAASTTPQKSPSPQTAESTALFTPKSLGAIEILEDIVVRRFSQELATIIDRNAFIMSAHLDLVEAKPEQEQDGKAVSERDDQLPLDLLIGSLDVGREVKHYAAQQQGFDGEMKDPVADQQDSDHFRDFLKSFQFKRLVVSVGLKDALPPDVKNKAESWLHRRLASEVGKMGEGTVSFIQSPQPKPSSLPESKTILDRMSELQDLIGKLIIALAMILVVLIWKMTSRNATSDKSDVKPDIIRIENSSAELGKEVLPLPIQTIELKEKENIAQQSAQLLDDIENHKKRIHELAMKNWKYTESMLRVWCAAGDEGKLKVPLFAELVGQEVGNLAIPADALQGLLPVFNRMPEMKLDEKCALLKKIFWDLLSIVSLGPESLERPFGYLGAMNLRMVKNVLIDENPKLQMLVSLYMPRELRTSYLNSLSLDQKRAMVRTAARMSEIPNDELRSSDRQIKTKLKLDYGSQAISLEMGLERLRESLSPIEEIVLFSNLSGDALDEFKKKTPSLAFLNSWRDQPLSQLIAKASPDQIVTYLRILPELKDRWLALAPRMTAEMVEDELSMGDNLSGEQKTRHMVAFLGVLDALIQQKMINLEQVFQDTASADLGDSPELGAGGEDQNAA